MRLGLCIFLLRVVLDASRDEWHLYTLLPSGLPVTHDDCVYINTIWYCREFRNTASACAGHWWSFTELREANIHQEQLLEWLIPVAIVDTYVQANTIGFVCNCSNGWFGAFCNFTLPDTSPLQLLISQLKDATLTAQTPRCYRDLAKQCDSGPYCLDWRSVCDGIWQCANGEDELNCERLEANACESDEFRCRNGACVPTEFVFDGEYDCQDLSDEHRLYSFADCHQRFDLTCDERMCNSEEPFSCGDGQCLPWQRLLDNTLTCTNFRDIFHRCELFQRSELSTGEDGACTTSAAQAVSSEVDRCLKALRKIFRASQINDLLEFERECPSIIIYPKQAWLAKDIYTAYDKQRLRALIINNTYYFSLLRESRKAHLLCKYNISTCWNISDLLHEPTTIFPFDRLPMSEYVTSDFYLCKNSTRLINERRINDGYIDCRFGDDEFRDDIVPTESHRYRCASPLMTQYVRTQQLGDGVRDCVDGSDELSPTVNWPWFRCTREDTYACAVLRSANNIAQARPQFHRLCDTFWDTAGGLGDEHDCLVWRCPTSLIRCNGTGQCIKEKWRCDGDFDCSDGEDERGAHCRPPSFALERLCNRTNEHFCVTDAYVRQPDRYRPCVAHSRVGDNRPDCLGGRDERNRIACPHDAAALGKRFLCLNGSCIDSTRVCDGVEDCQDGNDERLCIWSYQNSSLPPCSTFTCTNGKCLENHPCISKSTCQKSEHHIWCISPDTIPRSKGTSPTYRTFCDSGINVISMTVPQVEMQNAPVSPKVKRYCGRGLFVPPDVCFCPPPYYGPRCDFFSHRLPLRVRLDRLNARHDLSSVLHIYAFLLCNDSHIVDATNFVDSSQNSTKHDAYLQYERPLLGECQYAVQFEAYNDKLVLSGVWSFYMLFDFLPSYRFAKSLRFSPTSQCPSNIVCENNGTCQVTNNNQTKFVCICKAHWKGRRCEIHSPNQCSTNAVSRGPICVCSPGFLPPHCYVRNRVCEQRPDLCANNGTCHPHPILGQFTCVCAPGFIGSRCQQQLTSLTLVANRTLTSPLLIQLFAVRLGYTVLLSQLFTRTLPIRIDFDDGGALTQLALAHSFTVHDDRVSTELLLLNTECSNMVKNRTVQLETTLMCTNRYDWHVDARYFHEYCQLHGNITPCFYDGSYLCQCIAERSECIIYHTDAGRCKRDGICLNNGVCVQVDARNSRDVTCVCPSCMSGTICQFASGRFAISLETLVTTTNHSIFSYQIITPIIMFAVGLVFNSLTTLTFASPMKLNSPGCSIYLLVNSVLSQLVLSLLVARIIYQTVTRYRVLNEALSLTLCRLLPYLMSACWYTSLWLQLCVTLERMLVVVKPTSWLYIKTPCSAIFITIIILVMVFMSILVQITTYRIVQHPNERAIWCVADSKGSYNRYISLAHQLIPFVVNTIATSILLLGIVRSKITALGRSTLKTLRKAIMSRLDLIVAPSICFITQSPQIAILFLNSCDYTRTGWFTDITLVALYISFAPQMFLFFIYIMPSPLFRRMFMATRVVHCIRRLCFNSPR